MNKLLLFLALSLASSACKPTSKTLKTTATVLPTPSFNGHFQSERCQKITEARGNAAPIRFTLKDSLSDQKNTEQWLKDNAFTFPATTYHDGANAAPLKKMKIADDWTEFRHFTLNKQTLNLAQTIEQEDVALLIYGAPPNEMHVVTDTWAIVVRDRKTKAVKYALDFSNYRMAPEYVHKDKDFVSQDLLWAQLEDGILYTSHAHWTYAESSRNMNAYITAIDAAKGEVLWRSQPLVSNAVNFISHGSYIFTAYAFTLESANLYALDKTSGAVVGHFQLQPKSSSKKFIDFIAMKGNLIHVHCYDKVYILNHH